MPPMVGNQLPILLIDFPVLDTSTWTGWESVTDPLDRLLKAAVQDDIRLGISYRSS